VKADAAASAFAAVGANDPGVIFSKKRRLSRGCGMQLGISLDTEWISTERIEAEMDDITAGCRGFWIAPGSPYRTMNGALRIIEHARMNGRPLLGTCGGFQHIVIEYARNVLKIADAEHAEYDPYASKLVVSKLLCSLVGKRLDITINDETSTVHRIYNTSKIEENYYCNFGLNPEYQERLNDNGLVSVGVDDQGESRIVELKGHRFFIGTLYVPQVRSTKDNPHPLVTAFIKEIVKRTN